MAKYGKQNPKGQAPAAKGKGPSPKSSEPKNYLARPSTDGASDDKLRKIFYGIAGAGLLLMLFLSLGSGINADDKFQVDYSKKLMSYYASFGQDSAALNIPDGNMHLYGGFFEVVTGAVNAALGFEPTEIGYHHVRHIGCAILGWVAIFCAALFARHVGGWRAGIITLIIMLCSPRFLGDSLMNPKDIPFAAGYMMAIYNMAVLLDGFPVVNRKHLAGLIAGLGIALGIRAGGLLPFAMLFMFTGLHLMMRNGGIPALFDGGLLKRYGIPVLGAAAGGYVFALLFWPYALQNPISNPFIALSKFAELEVKIRVLFEGQNVMSDKTPWHYPLTWIFYTIPLAVIAGFAGYVLFYRRMSKNFHPLWVFAAIFSALFPILYVIYKNSVIHDGWRHLTFAYPTMAAAAGLFWHDLAGRFADRRNLQYAAFGALGLGLVDAAGFTAMNPKLPYVYFNPIAGGVKGAFGSFETDYWGVSIRQGIEYLEKEGILKKGMEEKVVIATNMFYSAKQLTAKYGDRVVVKYLKWDKRCDDAWDYALYPTRFIDGNTLKAGFWPPDNAVHTVYAGGAPILTVLKDNGKNCSLGMAAAKLNDYLTSRDRLKDEVTAVPDNDLAWANLAQAYMNIGQYEEAKAAAERALQINPDDAFAANLVGMYYINKDDAAKAKEQFLLSIKREPVNPAAYYYLAVISSSLGDKQTALLHLANGIEVSPGFKPAYELMIRIYEEMGNINAANNVRSQMPK